MRPAGFGPTTTILAAGLIVEAGLPWLVMWLSDLFRFDIPAWCAWPLFGTPPLVSFSAAFAWYRMRLRRTRPAESKLAHLHPEPPSQLCR